MALFYLPNVNNIKSNDKFDMSRMPQFMHSIQHKHDFNELIEII